MTRHVNIPIFIPHLGCPNQCVFCNQRKISGVEEFDPGTVKSEIENALSTLDAECEAEIAFFGGSFTGIDRELMISLLEIAQGYVNDGRVKSLRCSTRPDYIDEEIISILKKYSVKTVELGLQSSSDSVLSLSKRGHGFADEERAASLITEAGIALVGQMMIGLPGSTLKDELETAEFIIKSGASAARIYPTVVFCQTELCEMQKSGLYEPLSIEDAVERSALVLDKFVSGGVKVIRIGLCESENLHSEGSYFSGPNHPALGELVENRLYLLRLRRAFSEFSETRGKKFTVSVSRGSLSKAIGQKRINKRSLSTELGFSELIFNESDTLSDYDFSIVEERTNRCI